MYNPTKAHANASMGTHPGGKWTATMETDLKGGGVFLRLEAKPWPELSLDSVLDHDSPALRALPRRSRLRLSSSSGGNHGEVLLQMEQCHLRAGWNVTSYPGLVMSLLYDNNCTAIQVRLHTGKV